MLVAQGVLARLRRLLEHERLPLVAALLAVVLALPALASGRVVDDHVHARIFAEGVGIMGTPTRPLDMFSFFPDDAAGRDELLRYGMWPWWASEDLHLEFWRPLTALTHWADHALYPEAVALHHLHSILWYALVAWLAAQVLRRLLEPRWVAGLAALWYAAADVHALPAGWLANRSALCATAAGLCALWAHDRWRREGWRPGGALGPIAFAAALGAGEYGLGVGGYLLAHALWLDPGPRRRRLLALAPYALVALGWALLYRALGYGATGSGLYLDPAHDPVAFASAVLTRAPVLLASQLFLPLADLFPFLPRDRTWVLTLGGALGVGLCFAVLRPAERSPTRRVLAAGALLSLVPVCATFPNDRLSFFSSLGVTALVADLAARAAALPRARRALAWLLVLRQAAGFVLFPPRAFSGALLQRAFDRGAASLGPELGDATIVMVHAPSVFAANLVPVWRRAAGATLPARQRVLGTSFGAVEVERTDATTLVLRADGGYLALGFDEIAWTPTAPRPEGYRVALDDVTFTVLAATRDGRPLAVEARFDRPLESPTLRFVAWRGRGYVPFELPAVGERVGLAGVEIGDLFL